MEHWMKSMQEDIVDVKGQRDEERNNDPESEERKWLTKKYW